MIKTNPEKEKRKRRKKEEEEEEEEREREREREKKREDVRGKKRRESKESDTLTSPVGLDWYCPCALLPSKRP